jgi:hypothetical protein
MKNKLLISIFCLLLVFPFCSSAQISMKENYDLGETLIAKISGNFLQPPSEQSISFYRRHMSTTMDFSLTKVENDYYVYSKIPFEKIPDNYSIVIEDVRYFQGSTIKTDNLFYNFSISNETADFSIEPAALIAYSDFSVSVQNNLDSELSLEVSFLNETEPSGGFFSFFAGDSESASSFLLSPGEEKSIFFDIDDFSEGLNIINITSNNLKYSISASIIKEEENTEFNFEYSQINVSFKTYSLKSKKVKILNDGENTIENISLSLSSSLKSYLNLSTELIERIEPNSSAEITITFFSKKKISLAGSLEAEKESIVESLPIYVIFDEDAIDEEDDKDDDGYLDGDDCDDDNRSIHPGAKEYCDHTDNDCDGEIDEGCVEYVDKDKDGYSKDDDCNDNNNSIHPGAKEYCDKVDNNCNDKIDEECKNTTSETSKTCLELGGFVCENNFVCNVSYTEAKDDRCCVGGACVEKETSSINKIIGWTLLIFVIIIFSWFLTSKYIRTKNKVILPKSFRR